MRKNLFLFLAPIIAAFCMLCVANIQLLAAEEKNDGSFIWDDGKLSLYTEDIGYLQGELSALFGELPDLSGE
ncbi:MAG: hypothetical protein NC419_06415 [Muribaculaceae bacterium]|nr:hypothetical protein [Muribaculaceae bacterium]